jgi:hypothetical protein
VIRSSSKKTWTKSTESNRSEIESLAGEAQYLVVAPDSHVMATAAAAYAKTWAYLPEKEKEFVEASERGGFVCLLAVVDDETLGLALGATSRSGEGWHDRLAAVIGADHPALGDAFVLLDATARGGDPAVLAGLAQALRRTVPHRYLLAAAPPYVEMAADFFRDLGWRHLTDVDMGDGHAPWPVFAIETSRDGISEPRP